MNKTNPWGERVDDRIVWPVTAHEPSDPELQIVADNALELARYVEEWDSDPGSKRYYHWEAVDALGRAVEGKIVLLDIIFLKLRHP